MHLLLAFIKYNEIPLSWTPMVKQKRCPSYRGTYEISWGGGAGDDCIH